VTAFVRVVLTQGMDAVQQLVPAPSSGLLIPTRTAMSPSIFQTCVDDAFRSETTRR
jgi:hypothetical protein